MKNLLSLVLLGLMPQAFASDPAERATASSEQSALAVTIYNSDLALVKDARRVRVETGENRLAWRDVSARIQPETALLRALDGKPISLLEQNFDFDLLTPQKLLEKAVGSEIRVIRSHPTSGEERTESARVLAANSGVVLQFPDRVETGVPGRLVFDSVPPTLRDRPTLGMLFRAPQGGEQGLELSYLTGGLNWRADYVAELSARDDRLDLNGWVTLSNTSGASYPNARLQLIAGDVNRVRPEGRPAPMMKAMMAMADAAPEMREESLFEYHLYTLDRPTTLRENQTKQVALLSAAGVPVSKTFEFQGGEYYYRAPYGELGTRLKAGVFVTFQNKGGSLGLPLPKGVIRVYKKDASGHAQFIGEDRLDHTARNEAVRLRLGEAFDLTADRKQTEFQRISVGRNPVYESSYQIEVRNAKSEAVVVKVIEPMPGDWKILQESLPSQKPDARTAVWSVPVPAEGSVVLSWKVRVRD